MPRPSKAGRDYGGGSIYQEHTQHCPPPVEGERPAHRCTGPWVGAIASGFTKAGNRRRIKVKAKTEADVKVRLRERKRALELASDTNLDPRTTVKRWADTWLPIVERKQRPQTHNATRTAVRTWIIPTIGHKRLDALTPADVRAVAAAQAKEGLSTSTQLRRQSVLMSMLKAAILEGYGVPRRLLDVPAPGVAVNDRTDLGVENAVALLRLAAEPTDDLTGQPDPSRWVAALLQGLRQSEALGMTWPEINLDRASMTLSWQLQPLPYRERYNRDSGFRIPDGYEARQVEGRLHLVRPKSKAGWRVIPLVPWMVTSLRAWREITPANEHDLVWPSAAGRPQVSKADDAAWYALQKAAGVAHPTGRAFTMHEARHTTATLLLEAGVDPAVIIAILGHSKITTTRGYQHVNTAGALDALTAVAKRLELG